MSTDLSVLARLEEYYDAAPRAQSRAEEWGPFTLFVATSGWPYYARPQWGGRLGAPAAAPATADDIRRVLARQAELEVPRAMEWVDEVTLGLAATVESVGMSVARCPLLVLGGEPRGHVGTARMLAPADRDDLLAARAAVSVGFHAGGTGVGHEGLEERDAARGTAEARLDDHLLARIESGATRFCGVFVPGQPAVGPVGGGSHNPVGDVTEIVGVAVLPAYRRRGLAAQLSYVLATDARDLGVPAVFCSAQSDDVARVYEGVGFERVGTACIAEVDAEP